MKKRLEFYAGGTWETMREVEKIDVQVLNDELIEYVQSGSWTHDSVPAAWRVIDEHGYEIAYNSIDVDIPNPVSIEEDVFG
jgi:hypothetical protein